MYLACVGVCACAACASFGVDFRAPIWGKTILGAGLGIACAPAVHACAPVVHAEVGFELGCVLCALSAAGVCRLSFEGCGLLYLGRKAAQPECAKGDGEQIRIPVRKD